jgi:hypothetical protein
LKKGSYVLESVDNYDVDAFDGTKRIILSNSGPLGGKNKFMEIVFYLVGSVFFVIALLFFIKKKVSKNEFGKRRQFNKKVN